MKQWIRGLRGLVGLLAITASMQTRAVDPGAALGPAITVSSSDSAFRQQPAIARNDSGQAVVAWLVNAGLQSEIRARRLGAEGMPVGDEILVASTGSFAAQSLRDQPVVGIDGQGGFVVAWTDSTSRDRVRARRYASDGSPKGAAFEVHQAIGDGLLNPSLAMNSRGDFVLLWSVYPELALCPRPCLFTGAGRLEARRYDADGNSVGPVIVVERDFNLTLASVFGSSLAGRYSQQASVGIEGDGSFVVAWHRVGSLPGASASLMRRYGRLGLPGTTIRLGTAEQPLLEAMTLAVNDGGRAVIAYLQPSANSSALLQPYLRSYVGGRPEAPALQVSGVDVPSGSRLGLAINVAGSSVLAFEEEPASGGIPSRIIAQRLASGGGLLGNLLVVTAIGEGGSEPAVALDANEQLLVAWNSQDPRQSFAPSVIRLRAYAGD